MSRKFDMGEAVEFTRDEDDKSWWGRVANYDSDGAELIYTVNCPLNARGKKKLGREFRTFYVREKRLRKKEEGR